MNAMKSDICEFSSRWSLLTWYLFLCEIGSVPFLPAQNSPVGEKWAFLTSQIFYPGNFYSFSAEEFWASNFAPFPWDHSEFSEFFAVSLNINWLNDINWQSIVYIKKEALFYEKIQRKYEFFKDIELKWV